MSLYEPLGGWLKNDRLRLLSLTPATESDEPEICCHLQVVRLDDLPEYYALSYALGRPAEYGRFREVTDEKKFLVICNEDHEILVTKSLRAFLRRAQESPDLRNKRFWIDAICMNQEDTEEKTAQIQLMTKIYSRAQTVLMWLGEDDEFTEKGFDLIRELGTNRQPPVIANAKWLAAGKVFQRSYFSGAWVIQEVILGSDGGDVLVLCGPFSIEWQVLGHASHHITETEWVDSLNQLVAQHDQIDTRAGHRAFYGFPTIL
jgi:hypothetical protein